jgi:hypothetical protein
MAVSPLGISIMNSSSRKDTPTYSDSMSLVSCLLVCNTDELDHSDPAVAQLATPEKAAEE